MSYNTETDYIIKLLKSILRDTEPSHIPKDINWDKFFQLAKRHKICPLLYFGLKKLPKEQQLSIGHYDKFQFAYKKALVMDANRTFEIENLKSAFNNNSTDYILLKGSVSKHLYPDTSMRIMSDIDILYRGNEDNIDCIMKDNGYILIRREPKEAAYFKPSTEIKIELQTQLVDSGYEDWHAYLSDIWEKCDRVLKSHEYKMSHEDFYIYHIIHLAKHFKLGGIGLIHVIDVWVMMNSYHDLNYDYVNSQLENLNLSTFNNNIRMLVSYWFDDFSPSDEETVQTLSLMEEYIFRSGAFGSRKQQEINSIVHRNDQKFSIRKKIFPDKNTMVDYYGEFLQRYPIFIPVYWVRLNFSRLCSGKKNIRKKMHNINSISDEQIIKAKELMTRCGF